MGTLIQRAIDIVAPLIAPVPLYVEFATAGDRLAMDCVAYTSADLDLHLWPRLLERGQWRGRGCGVVFCSEEPASDDVAEEFHLVTCLAHEVAHFCNHGRQVLNRPEPEDIDPEELEACTASTPAERRLNRDIQHILAQHEAGVPRDRIEFETPMVVGHGPDFIRMAAHAGQRVRWYGNPIRLQHIMQTHLYGLRDAAQYQAAVSDECRHLSDIALWDLSQLPVPATLQQLFDEDTANG